MANAFTSVAPEVGAAEGEFEFEGHRLLDVCLIVIGEGKAAAELVRRRRTAGGRVCWLKTACLPDAAVPLTAWSEAQAAAVADARSFRWRPPPGYWGRRQAVGGPWRTSVRLGEGEVYSLTPGSDGRAPCVRVAAGDETRWELSGAVVFAGKGFGELRGVTTICETAAAARELDVSISCEDAKSFATFSPRHVAVWTALVLLNYLLFFPLMASFEPGLEPGEIPWWRASIILVPILPGGFSGVSDIFGPALTGVIVSWRVATAMGCICATFAFLASMVPVGWVGDRYCTWPLFVTTSFCCFAYMLVTIPLHIYCTARLRRAQRGPTARAPRWRAHGAWFLAILTGTFGTWVLSYAVSLLYIHLSVGEPVLASLALPLLTSGIELLVVLVTVQSYKFLVLATRQRRWRYTFLGDQRELMSFPICSTHAYAEATRLVSLFAATVKAPSYAWVAPLLLGFAQNVLLRTSQSTTWLSRLLPVRCAWLIAPDAGTILHNNARWFFGYPRFAPLLALGAANLAMRPAASPLFNLPATLLVVAALLLELLEDLIVTSGVLHSDAWKVRLAPHYVGVDPMSPDQVLGWDGEGTHPSIPALGFSDTRILEFRKIALIVGTSSLFGYTLLSLLLGAGFIHGACGSPIGDEDRLIDGLIWWSPLRC